METSAAYRFGSRPAQTEGKEPMAFREASISEEGPAMKGVALADPDRTGATLLEEDPNLAVNFAWTLIAAFLVFFMQAGFALLEAGSVRARSVSNVLTKNVVDFLMCGMAFWAFGFAIMFGGSAFTSGLEDGNDIFGSSGWFLAGDAYDVNTFKLW